MKVLIYFILNDMNNLKIRLSVFHLIKEQKSYEKYRFEFESVLKN